MTTNHPPLYLAACATRGLDPDTLRQVSLPRGPDGRFLPDPRRASKAPAERTGKK